MIGRFDGRRFGKPKSDAVSQFSSLQRRKYYYYFLYVLLKVATTWVLIIIKMGWQALS